MEEEAMLPQSRKEEEAYLEDTFRLLEEALIALDADLNQRKQQLSEDKRYLYENKTGMDHAEKISMRESITRSALLGEARAGYKQRLEKLLDRPYFGRIDFQEDQGGRVLPVYIGIHNFLDPKQKQNRIYDWRAPISGLFYDYERGPASFQTPELGDVNGEILLKRQYQIRNRRLEFMLESDLHIGDDILQKELSRSGDEKMKNIVATIQREQNAIIRNEEDTTLIIQGVAGSGKTSIALHRVAYLLYRQKEELTSQDVLILSPNKLFGDYISQVLPELGEEHIPEMSIEEFAEEVSGAQIKYRSFQEENQLLIREKDARLAERVAFKSTSNFLHLLNQYLVHIENHYFEARDFRLKNKYIVPAWFIKEKFQAYHRTPLLKRFRQIAADIESNILLYYKYEINAAERKEIRKLVSGMFRLTTVKQLYRDFYDWAAAPKMYKKPGKEGFEYNDVFPFLFLKTHLEGYQPHANVKHLVIDEMQDYSPVQYALISKFFRCKKTILGDRYQSLHASRGTTAERISQTFPNARVVELMKSYRSTAEIIELAKEVLPRADLDPMDRHGAPVGKVACDSQEQQVKTVEQWIEEYNQSHHRSLGIICKTESDAEAWQRELNQEHDIQLINSTSRKYLGGISILPVYLAKGLEFDQVILPDVDADNYQSETDRGLLYISITRAMHRLDMSFVIPKSPFLQPTD